MTNQTPTERIRQRRRQILVHRLLYYCYDLNYIPDFQFDKWLHELERLEQQYPIEASRVEYPEVTKSVGSSDIRTYPKSIIDAADRLKKYREEKE